MPHIPTYTHWVLQQNLSLNESPNLGERWLNPRRRLKLDSHEDFNTFNLFMFNTFNQMFNFFNIHILQWMPDSIFLCFDFDVLCVYHFVRSFFLSGSLDPGLIAAVPLQCPS